MKLLEELNLRHQALKLQAALLDTPYGEYLDVKLEASTREKIGGVSSGDKGLTDDPVIVLHISDRFEDVADPRGIKLVLIGSVCFVPAPLATDDPQNRVGLSVNSELSKILIWTLTHFTVSSKKLNRGSFDRAVKFGLTIEDFRDDAPRYFRIKDSIKASVKSKIPQYFAIYPKTAISSTSDARYSVYIASLISFDTDNGPLRIFYKLNFHESKIYLDKRGATPSWSDLDLDRCSLYELEKV